MRTWPALFAWGAGLIDVALAASISAGRAAPSALVVMGGLLAFGAGALLWGAATLRAGRVVASRTALAGAMAGAVLAAAAVAAGCSAIAAAAALALSAAAGVLVARMRRRRIAGIASRATLAGTVVGAVIVAALITPALSTTDAAAHSTTFPTVVTDPHAGH